MTDRKPRLNDTRRYRDATELVKLLKRRPELADLAYPAAFVANGIRESV